MKNFLIIIIAAATAMSIIPSAGASQETETERQNTTIYVLEMSNDRNLYVSSYSFVEQPPAITVRTLGSGMKITFPLERLDRIVEATLDGTQKVAYENIERSIIFENAGSISNIPEDDGIAVNFFVGNVTTVGISSRGGSSGWGNRGYTGSSFERGRSDNSSLGSGSSSLGGGSSSSRSSYGYSNRSSRGSGSSSSSSSSSSNPFEDIFKRMRGN